MWLNFPHNTLDRTVWFCLCQGSDGFTVFVPVFLMIMARGPVTKRNVNRAHTCAETRVKICVLLSQVGQQDFSHPCFMDELALWGSWPPAVLRPEFNSSDILNSLSTEVYIHGVKPPTKLLWFIIYVSLCWVSTSFYSTLILSFICCVCMQRSADMCL